MTVSVTPPDNIDDADQRCEITATVAPAAETNTNDWTIKAADLTIVNADGSFS